MGTTRKRCLGRVLPSPRAMGAGDPPPAATPADPAAPTAAILAIGDEILSGKYPEDNARFAIHELRALGVALRRIEVITDDVDDIARSVTDARARFDVVITSGGVGPTHDDRTMAGI